jgi:hypothetical protein
MVWATTDLRQALRWARRPLASSGGRIFVYEVDLTNVEPDPNARGDASSVMAQEGRVVALVHEMLVAHYDRLLSYQRAPRV